MVDGALVKSTALGTKVGVVVGRFTDDSVGKSLCVRTPHSVICSQPYTRIQARRVEPATLDDLTAHMADERAELDQRIATFEAESLRAIEKGAIGLDDGALVQYGWRDGFWRAGIIVGRYVDLGTGNVFLCVKVAHNASTRVQKYDVVPLTDNDNVSPATLEDLARSIEIERAQMAQRLSKFIDEVVSVMETTP